MKKRIPGVIVMSLVGVAALFGPAQASEKTVLRYDNTFVKPINKDWTVYLYQEFDFDKDRHHDLTGTCQEPGVVYSGFAKWLDVTAAVCQYQGKSNGKWPGQTIPYLAGTLKWSVAGLEMSNKSRVEYNERHALHDRWRYRDVFVIAPAYKWTRFQIQPFVQNEAFYDFQAHYLTGNQLMSGIRFPVTGNVSGSVWYMWDMAHSDVPNAGDWKTTPWIGVSTTVSF